MGRQRDLSRSRGRILAAATKEFAAKGFAGARTRAIARRARLNEQMIFHCFGSKEGLYQSVLHEELGRITEILESRGNMTFATHLATGFEALSDSHDQLRIWQWEALAERHGDLIAGDERRGFFKAEAAQLRRAQLRGNLPANLNPGLMLIASIALRAIPLLLPQLVLSVTGLESEDPRFRRKWGRFLRAFGKKIAPLPRNPRNKARGTLTNRRGTGLLSNGADG
jgi:TetR/AcrR family transcriptional regulator